MLVENSEDRFFVLLYLDVGKKDEKERKWMFTNLFMNSMGSGVRGQESAKRFFENNRGALEGVVKRAKEFWKRRRSVYTPHFPVFIPSFVYFEDERLREINTIYYESMYYDKSAGREGLRKVYEEYKKLLENEKDETKRAVILNNLGCVHFILVADGVEKDYKKIMEYFYEASSNGKVVEVVYNLAVVSFFLKSYSQSLLLIEHAIKLFPEWAEAHYLKAENLKNLGRNNEAVEEYKKAIELGMVNKVEIAAKEEMEKLEKGYEPTPIEKIIYERYGKTGVEVYRRMDGVRSGEDITRELGISKEKLIEIVRFLNKKGIVKIEKEGASKRMEEETLELEFESQRVNFTNVAGMDKWKKRMEIEVIQPLKNRELARKYGIKSGNILLYGPPGCGKSLIAEAIAGELGTKVIKVDIAEILSMYVGNAEKNMKRIFEKAKENQPCIIIFDELEGLGGMREPRMCNIGLVDQFVKELDDINRKSLDVVVIGTTNMPWMVDSAVLRRFNSVVYVPEPDRETRKEIFEYYTKNLPIGKVDFEELARKTEGMTSSNIENICKKAALFAYREAFKGKERKIEKNDFEEAIKEERSAVQLWKEQSKNYQVSPMFRELGLREERKERGMYV